MGSHISFASLKFNTFCLSILAPSAAPTVTWDIITSINQSSLSYPVTEYNINFIFDPSKSNIALAYDDSNPYWINFNSNNFTSITQSIATSADNPATASVLKGRILYMLGLTNK